MKWIKLDSFSLKFIFHLVFDTCVVDLGLKLFISPPPPPPPPPLPRAPPPAPPPPPHNVETYIVFYMYKKLKICFLFILQRIKIGHFLYQGIKIKMPTEQRPHRRGTCSAASSDGGTNTFMQRRFFL